MSNDEADYSAHNYNFQTPYPARKSPSDGQDEGHKTQRRVSFGESQLPALYPNEQLPPSTPMKAKVTDADSPYVDSPDVVELNENVMEIVFKRAKKQAPFSLGSTLSPTCDLKSLPHLIGLLLPLRFFAKGWSMWQKGIANNSRMAECLEEKRAHVFNIIIDVTSHTGQKALDLLDEARICLQSQESDTHPSVIQCLLIHIWATHPKSQRRDITLLTLQDYLLSKDDAEVRHLLHTTATGQSLNLYHDTNVHVDIHDFPGCKRLDPTRNIETFDKHWNGCYLEITVVM
jgi:hypothetical protein